MASFATHSLVQQMFHDPGLVQQLQTDPEPIFERYGVPEPERAALRDGTPPALAAIGLHPILQVHWMLTRTEQAREIFNAEGYFKRLEGWKLDG